MENVISAAALLGLVSLVYISAYKTGYKTAKNETASALKAYSEPITSLLDQIDKSLDKQIQQDRRKSKDSD